MTSISITLVVIYAIGLVYTIAIELGTPEEVKLSGWKHALNMFVIFVLSPLYIFEGILQLVILLLNIFLRKTKI